MIYFKLIVIKVERATRGLFQKLFLFRSFFSLSFSLSLSLLPIFYFINSFWEVNIFFLQNKYLLIINRTGEKNDQIFLIWCFFFPYALLLLLTIQFHDYFFFSLLNVIVTINAAAFVCTPATLRITAAYLACNYQIIKMFVLAFMIN